MGKRSCVGFGVIAAAFLVAPAYMQAQSAESKVAQKGTAMAKHAKGTFEVKLNPVDGGDKAEGSNLGRMSIDKQLQGDLEGTSKGQMLTAMTDVKGSAGYVAIERITGTLHGRKGNFVLQHTGTMAGASQQLSITVVPDSGSGQLVGIAGKMTINIVDGKHFYEFEYTLPDAR
jgi:Protein of unknown function (DUF3224)